VWFLDWDSRTLALGLARRPFRLVLTRLPLVGSKGQNVVFCHEQQAQRWLEGSGVGVGSCRVPVVHQRPSFAGRRKLEVKQKDYSSSDEKGEEESGVQNVDLVEDML